MRQTLDATDKLTSFRLLTPSGYDEGPFHRMHTSTGYERLLAGAQRLRGEIYVEDGAIPSTSLTDDGRYLQKSDCESWHFLVVDHAENIKACIRFCVHPNEVDCFDLEALHHPTLRSGPFGSRIQRAIQNHIEQARRLGVLYVEVGGWAIAEEIRCTTEALRMVLMIYAFGKIAGRAFGLSTVTTRHHSSSILRRLGGASLVDAGEEIPPYRDAEYGCEMELLTFDSSSPNPRYAEWIEDCHRALTGMVAIGPESRATDIGSLVRLERAISDVRSERHRFAANLA